MKGILLAGGAGSRLYPMTLVASKQLQPVYDKPMVYYPLATLIEGGVREFCLISTPRDLPRFEHLLGNGRSWGLSIQYCAQPRPEGVAQALSLAEGFIGSDDVALILGDSIFYGGDLIPRAFGEFAGGGTIFTYYVHNPHRYGVVTMNPEGQPVEIAEKPAQPRSSYAVTGLYLFDCRAATIAKVLQPSARGELEITDVIGDYLRRGELRVHRLGRGYAWLDAGTSSSFHEASAYVRTIEKRQGIKIGCPEEAAYRRGFISLKQLAGLAREMPDCEYRDYLNRIIAEERP